MTDDRSDLEIDFGGCDSCGEGYPEKECPKSLRPCGHHCNCLEYNGGCHWCGAETSEDGESIVMPETRELEAAR